MVTSAAEPSRLRTVATSTALPAAQRVVTVVSIAGGVTGSAATEATR